MERQQQQQQQRRDDEEDNKKPVKKNADNNEIDIRRNIATQMETAHEGLLSNDRRLLKAYLGYIPVLQLHDGIKRIDDACAYVRSTLWPDDDKLTQKPQKEFEERPYNLAEEYVKEKKGQEIPRIFPKETLDDARKMFMEAPKDIVSPEAESGLLRAFQVKNKEEESLSLSRSFAHSLARSLTLAHSLAHSLTRSLTRSLASILIFSFSFFGFLHTRRICEEISLLISRVEKTEALCASSY